MGNGPKVKGQATKRPVASARAPVNDALKEMLNKQNLPSGWSPVANIESTRPSDIMKDGVKTRLSDGTEVTIAPDPSSYYGNNYIVSINGQPFTFMPNIDETYRPSEIMEPDENKRNKSIPVYGSVAKDVEQAIKDYRSNPLNKPAVGGADRVNVAAKDFLALSDQIKSLISSTVSDKEFIAEIKKLSTNYPSINVQDVLDLGTEKNFNAVYEPLAKIATRDLPELMENLAKSGRSPAAMKAMRDHIGGVVESTVKEVYIPFTLALRRMTSLDTEGTPVRGLSYQGKKRIDVLDAQTISGTVQAVKRQINTKVETALNKAGTPKKTITSLELK